MTTPPAKAGGFSDKPWANARASRPKAPSGPRARNRSALPLGFSQRSRFDGRAYPGQPATGISKSDGRINAKSDFSFRGSAAVCSAL